MTATFNTIELEKILVPRLETDLERLRNQFQSNKQEVGTRYAFIDNLLPEELAHTIHSSFSGERPWRQMSSFREKKYTSKQFDGFPAVLGEITFAIQSPPILKIMEKITGIEGQVADPKLYAGGLSKMGKGDFLDPHIDNSHDQGRNVYRRLNLLYYVTPEWGTEDGGHLELWDLPVKNKVTIESKFNRLVIMETHDHSWHSVSKVKKDHAFRCCVSNYNFSMVSPTGKDYYHVTSFHNRPEQPAKGLVYHFDNLLRSGIRTLKKEGFGKKDLYQGPSQK